MAAGLKRWKSMSRLGSKLCSRKPQPAYSAVSIFHLNTFLRKRLNGTLGWPRAVKPHC